MGFKPGDLVEDNEGDKAEIVEVSPDGATIKVRYDCTGKTTDWTRATSWSNLSERVRELDSDESKLREAQHTEYQAWLALVQEMRQAGVGDINAGGKHERLHDAICAWGEELAQLRMADPDPSNAERALDKRRVKYLGSS